MRTHAPLRRADYRRNSPAFFDSGAIMVAAANPGINDRYVGLAHGPSCYGNRIDCFAWGDGIMTASALSTTPGGLNGYTDGISSTSGLFGGTSGASAIIAGAAISLQGMRLARQGVFLTSAEVRGLLKDLSLNTSPAPGDVGNWVRCRISNAWLNISARFSCVSSSPCRRPGSSP